MKLILSFFVWIILLGGIVAIPSAWAEQNPFLQRSTPQAQTPPSPVLTEGTQPDSGLTGLKNQFQTWQYHLNSQLAHYTREAQSGKNPNVWWLLGGIAFAYGALHSLGPGHGKCLICAYFLAEASSLRQGLVLGYLVAGVHALSALSVVLILHVFLVQAGQRFFDNTASLMAVGGYALIILMGSLLLFRALRSLKQTAEPQVCHEPSCEHDHSHAENAHAHAPHAQTAPKRPWQLFWLAVGIGALPCPGALTLLMFSVSLNLLGLGVFLAVMIALGMGVTVSLMALMTIASRRGALKGLLRLGKGVPHRAEQWLRISGAFLTVFLGSLLLWASL